MANGMALAVSGLAPETLDIYFFHRAVAGHFRADDHFELPDFRGAEELFFRLLYEVTGGTIIHC